MARSALCGRLVYAFNVLDPEAAFQDLGSLARTWMTGKRAERAAMREIEDILRTIWLQRGMASYSHQIQLGTNVFSSQIPRTALTT